MNNLYRNTETGQCYKKLKTGTGRYSGMCLWQLMRKVLLLYVPDRSREPFWLDDCGFEPI